MNKQHQIWFQAFLKNCEQSNKSERTLVNYKIDLKKYIHWYESTHKGNLNAANAHVITEYIAFLTYGQDQNPSEKMIVLPRHQQPKSPNKFWNKIKFWGQAILPWKKNREKTREKNQEKIKGKAIEKKIQLPEGTSSNQKESLFTPQNSIQETQLLAVSSRRRHLSTIKNFYEFLKQSNEDVNDLFQANPVKSKLHGIKLKDEDIEHTKLLTGEDWKAISETIFRPKESLIVNLLYWGGLRLNELTQLKINAFNERTRSITFARKGGYVHTLFVEEDELIFSLFRNYMAMRKHPQCEYLFTNKFGNGLSSRSMYTLIMKIIRKSGCPTPDLTPHSFRKACATNLYEKTKDLLFVRDYLNHADAKVTQTYIEKFEGQRSRPNTRTNY